MKTALVSAIISAVVSVIATVLTMGLVAPTTASAQEGVIRAQEFVLVGSDGSTRAWLRERIDPRNPSGAAVFQLLQGGQIRVAMAYGQRSPEAAAVNLLDSDGKVRINLGVATGLEQATNGDLTRIGVLDRNGRVRLAMGVDFEGTPFIVLLDGAGQPTWNVGAPLPNVLKAGG